MGGAVPLLESLSLGVKSCASQIDIRDANLHPGPSRKEYTPLKRGFPYSLGLQDLQYLGTRVPYPAWPAEDCTLSLGPRGYALALIIERITADL